MFSDLKGINLKAELKYAVRVESHQLDTLRALQPARNIEGRFSCRVHYSGWKEKGKGLKYSFHFHTSRRKMTARYLCVGLPSL